MLDQGHTLTVTMLRCTENINLRDEYPLETDIQDKGQCLGSFVCELAVRPFLGESATELYQEAEHFHQGLRTKLQVVEDNRWKQGRAWVQDTKLSGAFERPDPNIDKSKLPRKDVLYKQEGKAMVSAVKWAENAQGLIIRLYNIEQTGSSVVLKFEERLNKVLRTNLLEEVLDDIFMDYHDVIMELGSKKIETLLLEIAMNQKTNPTP